MSLLDKSLEYGPSDFFAPNLVVAVFVVCRRADWARWSYAHGNSNIHAFS